VSVGRGTLGQILQAAAGADCTLVSLGDSAAQPHGARLTGRQTAQKRGTRLGSWDCWDAGIRMELGLSSHWLQ
jgi:hypothetical protein